MMSHAECVAAPDDRSDRAGISKRIAFGIVAFVAVVAIVIAATSRILLELIEPLKIETTRVDELFAIMRIHGAIAVLSCALALTLRRRSSVSRAWPKATLLSAIVYLCFALDQIVGYYYPPPGQSSPLVVAHPRRGFSLQPDRGAIDSEFDVRTDQYGFRGAPLSKAKPPGETRILFLGDSVVYGFMLPNGQTPVDQTQRFLAGRLPDRRIRCINAGMFGYATWQELDLMQHEGLDVEPDVVVLVFCLNDMLDVLGVERGVAMRFLVNLEPHVSSHWSGTVRAVSALAGKRQSNRTPKREMWQSNRVFEPGHPGGLNDLDQIYLEPPLPVVAEAWEKCFEDLSAIANVCSAKSIPFVLVYAPSVHEVTRDSTYRRSGRVLDLWAKDAGVPFLDTTDALVAACERESLNADAMFLDSVHLSAIGSRVMSEAIGRIATEAIKGVDRKAPGGTPIRDGS